jgi:hypothetical protein
VQLLARDIVLQDVFDGKTGMLGLIEGNKVLFMGFENIGLFITSWARHNVLNNLEYRGVVEDIVPFPLFDFDLLCGYSRSDIALWVMVAWHIDIECHICHAIHHGFVSMLEHRVDLLLRCSFLNYKIDTHGKLPVTGYVINIVFLGYSLVTKPFPFIYLLLLTHIRMTNADCNTSLRVRGRRTQPPHSLLTASSQPPTTRTKTMSKNNVFHLDEVIITQHETIA